ncbi:MAG TPA: hypothetical protein VE669_11340 [Actinomycetota bacterium]|nr:hypothetical protein [Actinomycetota bacterium]
MAEMNDAERKLAGTYEQLKGILQEHGEDLAPYQHRNALKALAALWQVANGLDLDPGQLYDLGA